VTVAQQTQPAAPALVPTGGIFPLTRYSASITYQVGDKQRTLSVEIDPRSGQSSSARNDDLEYALRIELEDGSLVVHQELTVFRPCQLLSVEPLVLQHSDASDVSAYYHNGWQSWSGSSALLSEQREPRIRAKFLEEVLSSPFLPRPRGKGSFTSSLCTAACSPRGAAVVLGYLDTADNFGGFTMQTARGGGASITSLVSYEGTPLHADEKRKLPRLWVWWGNDANVGLEQYATRVGQEMNARVPKDAEVGWCSWYHYFTKIDETIIRKNLSEAVRLREALPFSLFQIDDGWQPALGDWLLPSKTFPSGMGAMAREIRDAGFTAGLWLAAFVAYPNSTLYSEHPDWFVKNSAGKPRYGMWNWNWGLLDTARALDLTHPDVQKWLRLVFHTIAHDWGYKFIKIDFLHAAALPGKRHNLRMTGAEALRAGMEIIREAVGDDVHVLGCGLPLGPAIGMVDSNRVGMDVAPFWTNWLSKYVGQDYEMMSAKVATRNALTRSFMHRRLWQNDPDCILLRSEQTALTQDEIYTVVTAAALCAGSLLISDDLSLLGNAQRELAQRAVKLHAQACQMQTRALDLMERDFPTLLLCEGAGACYLAVFNPEDKPVRRRIPLMEYSALLGRSRPGSVAEYWTHETYQIVDDTIDLGLVPAHGVRLLTLNG